ncbi:MAG: Arc family DNA binding domain-containing protein [Eudoraea sp.]|uniref:Arc family DNA binding domain-containing protein n=1 Tax=Eudoraea sp. TaxID=1979955 RepID=UPI003C76B1EB
MSKRKSFALRIDPETFKRIEKWADDEFRSVNGQIEWIINKSLKDAKRLPNKLKSKENNKDTKL